MKKLISLLALATVCACAKQVTDSGTGTLSFSLASDISLTEVCKSNVGDYAKIPTADDFHLVLRNYSSQIAWEGDFNDWDNDKKFMAGEYTASISYGNPEEEGAGKACFGAEKTFNVVAFENTPVTLQPSLTNCIIKVKEGSYLKNYFSERAYSITTAAGNSFDITEGDAIFIDAYKFTLEATFTRAGGKTSEFKKTFTDLKAANCYTIGVELTNVGGTGIAVTFNDNVETITIEEDLSI